jgi:hypothetical protein
MKRLAIAALGLWACGTPAEADPKKEVCQRTLLPPPYTGEGEGGHPMSADEKNAEVSKATPIVGTCDGRLRDRVETSILGAGAARAKPASAAWDHKGKVDYYDRVLGALALTDDEQRQLVRDGMVVPARLEYDNYSSAYYDIHRGQLPIFVTADSILHAIYASHDQLLADLESNVLIHRLDDALGRMQCALGAAAKEYPKEVVEDLDLYLLVARKLLSDQDTLAPQVSPSIAQRAQDIVSQIQYPTGLTEIELFGRKRAFDASAYEPRGHYAGDYTLQPYFRSAMWLSRMEFNLASRDTRSSTPGYTPDPSETPREAVDALALADLADRSGALADLAVIDRTWSSFAGGREDVPLADLNALRKKAGIGKLTIPDSADRLRAAIGDRYHRTVNTFPNPNVKNLPAIATVLGPRVTLDTTALGMVPASLDPTEAGAAVAYMLGNDRALAYTGQLDRRQLDAARGSLAAVKPRDDLYSAWLDAIRALSRPVTGSQPSFAATSAYADLRLDTTLAAYGQLRHNHVLIQAQMYDVGGCEIPDGYVEPAPEVYDALARWAKDGERVFGQLDTKHETGGEKYFARVQHVMTLLATISRHELANRPLTADEKRFLAMAVEMREASAWNYNGDFPLPTYDGWYIDLFTNSDAAFHRASFIADYATHDRQDMGKWVDYLGARGPRLGLFVVDADGAPRLMVGPVAQAFAASGPIANRFTDETADKAKALAPWAASYTVGAPVAPSFTIAAARLPPKPAKVAGGPNMGAEYNRKRQLEAYSVADGEIAIVADKDLGDITIDLRDHHFVTLATMKVHAPAGRTVVKMKVTDGVESVLVHAGTFSGRADLALDGIAGQAFGGAIFVDPYAQKRKH